MRALLIIYGPFLRVAARTFIRMVLSRGVNFGGHFGGQSVQVCMDQNGVVYNRLNKSVRKS